MHIIIYIVSVIVLNISLYGQNEYIDQIKVVDRCTHLTEVVTVKSLGIKGVLYEDFEAPKAIRACQKSIKEHPDDPHTKFLMARAYTKAGRYEEGFDLVKRSCQSGDVGGCTLLAGYYDHGLYQRKHDAKKSYLLYLWSCNKGDPQACHNLAMNIENKRRFVPKDSKSKEDYLLETCMSGMYGEACRVYANHIYFKTIDYDKDLHEYTNYMACINGHNNACSELAKLLKTNKDPLQKQKLFYSMEASCDSGNAKACGKTGGFYNRGGKTRLNHLLALTQYEEGCNNGAERFSCWYAGRYRISKVEGVVQDIPLGIKQLEKSCYIGMNTFACYDLAKFYLFTNEAGYRDKNKAIRPLERACKIGNVRSLYLGCDQKIDICCKAKKRYEKKQNKQ